MNITKTDVLFVLSKHAGKWVRPKTIAKGLKLNTTEGINRVSVLLYRLRNNEHIERRSNSHDYQYRYIEDKSGYPTSENAYPKIERCEKAVPDSDKFNAFTFIEPLPNITEGFCELCGLYTQLSYKAEKSNRWVFACKKCGEEIKKQSEVFEWGCFA